MKLNFRQLKKALFTTLISTTLISATLLTFAQASNAISLFDQSFNPVQNYTKIVPTNGELPGIVGVTSLAIGPSPDLTLGYLEFNNITLPSNLLSLDSAKLNLFGHGVGQVSLYSVDSSWINNVNQNSINALRSNPNALIGTIFMQGYSVPQAYSFDLLGNLPTPSGSFVLLGSTGMDVATFTAYDANNPLPQAPNIQITGIQQTGGIPAPEPTSMALSVMGIAGLFGRIRRKK